jgi:hypothetical protein
MNGELTGVWHHTWKEIWAPLSKSPIAPADLFNELVGGLAPRPVLPVPPNPPPPESYNEVGELVGAAALEEASAYNIALAQYAAARDEYETAVAGSNAKPLFRKILNLAGSSEQTAVVFLEDTYKILGVFHPFVSDTYTKLVKKLLSKFNIRYELRADFSLHATIPGVFSKMLSELRAVSVSNQHVSGMLDEFEEAYADLRSSRSEARLKTCLQKQFNLLEALAASCAGVTGTTLGAMCDELDWPHATIKEVGKKLYGFRSNYPGLGHGGNPGSVLRPISMKDFVSISLMLAAFTPYVSDQMNADRCYTG